ncbi:MAG: DMT family transporter [Pseudomonadota bacterium]
MSLADRPGVGIGLRILSGVLMAGMYVSVKAVSDGVPLGEIVFFRSFFALIPLLVFLWLRGEFPQGLATKRPLDHFLRSSFGALALFAAFAALARLNIAEAILIAQLSPMLTAVLAVFLLSERLTVWRVVGLLLGFAGVLALVWPELGGGTLERNRLIGIALGLFSAGLSALALIMVRSLNRTESPGAIALYFVVASMAGAVLTLPFGWVWPTGSAFWLLVSAGLFGGFAHIAMTLSFRYAEASRLAPFEYIALVWPLLADLMIFRLPLSSSFLLAAPLVLVGAAVAAMEGKSRTKAF